MWSIAVLYITKMALLSRYIRILQKKNGHLTKCLVHIGNNSGNTLKDELINSYATSIQAELTVNDFKM